jgi:hypothetical protein
MHSVTDCTDDVTTPKVTAFATPNGDRVEVWTPSDPGPNIPNDFRELEGDNVALLQTANGHVLIAGCAVPEA